MRDVLFTLLISPPDLSPDSAEGKEIIVLICECSKFSIVFIKVLFRVSLGYILKKTQNMLEKILH